MPFFDAVVRVRLTAEEHERIEDVITKSTVNGDLQPKYESASHFIRCAINKLIREEQRGYEIIVTKKKK